ncbi:TonB-dependent receptor [Sphingomonas sp. R647]|uniref:TonB-dependent receptor n=1 Tax=Sphingomonas sp. R647 TaxID=2875233 RepID=UPI001CD81234|nr:TonB-dependent receptor [Sphingomonas sp. R647]MCA1197596.1 TonB-dependent receptor [Sphingomonas sp. R647]
MKFTALLLATSVLAAPVLAQTSDHTERDRSSRNPVHGETTDEVVISAPGLERLDLLAGTSVITGDELVRDIRGQIGESLTQVPGVSATSFSPGASRPVLRGFQGERVRVLTDGLGTLDVSNTSTDHAVSIEPLTAERIEVLRGPAVLLFGSQAIGGAVNVLDRRIPRAVPENGFHVDAIGAYGSAADERGGGAAVDFAITPQIVAHIDGSYRKSDDLRVGGYVLSDPLRAEQLEIAAEEADEGHLEEAEEALENANRRGRLPNSGTRTYTLGGGLALINDGGSLGFSAGYYDTNYGVPARPGAEHHHDDGGVVDPDAEEHDHGEEAVTIGLKQFRADVRGEVKIGGFIDALRVRAGYSDYEHTEFEGEEVGTVFNAEGFEGRLELVQANRNGWRGVTGFQGFTRDFAAVGAEAFVPQNVTDQYGFFTLQEVDLGAIGLEGALRYEHTRVRAGEVKLDLDEDGPTAAFDRRFDAFSGAIGLSYAVTPQVKVGVNASRAVRAPSAEELFSNGPHIATQSYEVGNPNFRTEKSWGGEVYARGAAGPVRFQIAAYANWFDDYIYEVATGDEIDELPVFEFRQSDARYLGVEGEVSTTFIDGGEGGFSLGGNLVADYVNAELGDGSAVPRIPPFRVLAGIDASQGAFGGRVEVEHAIRQTRVAAFETETPAFTLVNASVTWHPLGEKRETAIILSANNIFDVDARRHASFTKDFVPLPGRDIRVSARLSF